MSDPTRDGTTTNYKLSRYSLHEAIRSLLVSRLTDRELGRRVPCFRCSMLSPADEMRPAAAFRRARASVPPRLSAARSATVIQMQ